MKTEGRGEYYLKVLFTALIVIAVIVIGIRAFEFRFDKKYEQIKTDVFVFNEYYRCEINYKDLNYKGVCSDGVLTGIRQFVESDMGLKILDVCLNSPYGYRHDVCKELGVN